MFSNTVSLSPSLIDTQRIFNTHKTASKITVLYILMQLVPVATQSKAWVCIHSLAGIVGSNPARGMDVSVVRIVCCHVEVCDRLITHPEQSYQLWCVIMCDLETSRMRRPWLVFGCSATGGKKYNVHIFRHQMSQTDFHWHPVDMSMCTRRQLCAK